MSEINVPIVVVAYNRPRSISRILKSLSEAEYSKNNIDLIISIDNGDNSEVLNIANDFKWNFGAKNVIYQETNLGLRNHILKCGDLTNKYDAIILLEDDLYVSKNFYFFACQSLEFSKENNNIAGVSLYNHQLNVHTKDIFSPIEDGYDNWYFQFASSWGQAWTKGQWQGFKKWYEQNQTLNEAIIIPQNVKNWSDKSWLKFYISYMVELNKFFLYPKVSMTSNFSDAGTHMGQDTTIYQVPLYFGQKRAFNFSDLETSNSVYDSFFENLELHEILGYSKEEISIDLFGSKPPIKSRYLLTTRIADFQIVRSFGRSLKPIDANVILGVDGQDIFLYDTTIPKENNIKVGNYRKIIYNLKYISFDNITMLFITEIKMKLNRIFKKLTNQ